MPPKKAAAAKIGCPTSYFFCSPSFFLCRILLRRLRKILLRGDHQVIHNCDVHAPDFARPSAVSLDASDMVSAKPAIRITRLIDAEFVHHQVLRGRTLNIATPGRHGRARTRVGRGAGRQACVESRLDICWKDRQRAVTVRSG
jgi:hypothetical protein